MTRLATTLALGISWSVAGGCQKTAPEKSAASTSDDAHADGASPAPGINRAPSHGYGTDIVWRHLAEAQTESKTAGKPMMVFVHASWCGRCKELRPVFDDPALVAASSELLMVNLDHDKSKDARTTFAPDGSYVPRIMFFDPSGARIDDIVNPRSPQFPLYYSSGNKRELIAAMRRATESAAPPP